MIRVLDSPTCWGCATKNPNKFGTPIYYPRKLPETRLLKVSATSFAEGLLTEAVNDSHLMTNGKLTWYTTSHAMIVRVFNELVVAPLSTCSVTT